MLVMCHEYKDLLKCVYVLNWHLRPWFSPEDLLPAVYNMLFSRDVSILPI